MEDITKKTQNAWDTYDETELSEVFALGERYKEFISLCKTERECVDELI